MIREGQKNRVYPENAQYTRESHNEERNRITRYATPTLDSHMVVSGPRASETHRRWAQGSSGPARGQGPGGYIGRTQVSCLSSELG